ncbi:MAG TPA: SpoIID/LytB domain-containing protein, partial [Mycobacterium sp.]
MTTFEPSVSPGRFPRRPVRWPGLGSALLRAVASAALAVPPTASADPTTSARSGSFTITGGGFGHGLGMSQYGAYGAAKRGLQHEQILAFYYPGTKITTQKASSIRVWISSDTDGDVRALPAAGLRVADNSGHSYKLPTGSGYKAWRISRAGAGYRLAYKTASGSWQTRSTGLATSTWRFTGASLTTVQLPGGKSRTFRGSVALVKRGSSGRTVNTVSLEHYVQAVVPAEMPTSWHLEAVKTQAVAARSYAVMLRGFNRTDRGYDICDTTACQVYRGAGFETRNGLAATRGTAGQILTYKGAVALTMFASSNGGWRKTGAYPYLRAGADPYDGVIKSQAWSRKITTAALRRAYPSAGTVSKIKITSRDGQGRWGGRVLWMKLIGSKKTLTVTGGAFQRKFAMRSNYFTVNGT